MPMDSYSLLLMCGTAPLVLLYAIGTWQDIQDQKRRLDAQAHEASVKPASADDTPDDRRPHAGAHHAEQGAASRRRREIDHPSPVRSPVEQGRRRGDVAPASRARGQAAASVQCGAGPPARRGDAIRDGLPMMCLGMAAGLTVIAALTLLGRFDRSGGQSSDDGTRP